MAYPIATMADGRIKYSDGSIKLPMSSATNPNAANYRPANMTPVNTPYVPAPTGGNQGKVLGAATGGGGGGGGGGDTRLDQLAKMNRNPVQESEYQQLLNAISGGDQSRIESERRARLEANNRALQNVLDFVSGARGRAQTGLDQALSAIGGFRERSRGSFNEANEMIGKQFGEAELSNIQESSRRLGEGARSFNDLYAQAGNRLNKMGLSNLMSGINKLEEAYGRNQGEIADARATNVRQNVLNRQNQETSNRQLLDERLAQAEEEERGRRASFEDLLANYNLYEQQARGGRDSADAGIESWASGALNALAQRDQMLKALAIDPMSGRSTAALESQTYNPQFNLTDSLNQAFTNVMAQQPTQQAVTQNANPVVSNRLADLVQNVRTPNLLEQLQRRFF